MLARASISASTLADQVGACAAALAPLHALIEAHVMAAERLHGDDTTVPVLAKGKTATGRLWVLGVRRPRFRVQRPSRSLAQLRRVRCQSSGIRPASKSAISACVLRCRGAAMIEASIICPPMARYPRWRRCMSKRANRTSIALVMLRSLRNSQIVRASGTRPCKSRPRKRMKLRWFLIWNPVARLPARIAPAAPAP